MWHSFEVGKQYFIRTLSMYYVGKLVGITETDLVLIKAAWIPDTGRFHQFLLTGEPNECEPYPPDSHVMVSRGPILDFCEFNFKLPLEVK